MPCPTPTNFSAWLARHAPIIPDNLMRRAGWKLLDRVIRRSDPTTRYHRIAQAILAAWPDTVGLTVDATGRVSIWRQAATNALSSNSPFPSPTDIAHAIRVVEAVGIAREIQCSDRIALLARDPADNGEIRELRSQREKEQEYFEAVAAAMRSFCTMFGRRNS